MVAHFYLLYFLLLITFSLLIGPLVLNSIVVVYFFILLFQFLMLYCIICVHTSLICVIFWYFYLIICKRRVFMYFFLVVCFPFIFSVFRFGVFHRSVSNIVGERGQYWRTRLLHYTQCVISLLRLVFISLCSYVFTGTPSKGRGMFLFTEMQDSRTTTRRTHCKARSVNTCKS